jgi:hypothetical protein
MDTCIDISMCCKIFSLELNNTTIATAEEMKIYGLMKKMIKFLCG